MYVPSPPHPFHSSAVRLFQCAQLLYWIELGNVSFCEQKAKYAMFYFNNSHATLINYGRVDAYDVEHLFISKELIKEWK